MDEPGSQWKFLLAMRTINVRMILDNMHIVSTIDYIINLQGDNSCIAIRVVRTI